MRSREFKVSPFQVPLVGLATMATILVYASATIERYHILFEPLLAKVLLYGLFLATSYAIVRGAGALTRGETRPREDFITKCAFLLFLLNSVGLNLTCIVYLLWGPFASFGFDFTLMTLLSVFLLVNIRRIRREG